MNEGAGLQVKFWGVRGSIPTPQIENLTYGGNTPCVEVRSANSDVLIFDGGTGIRNLGQSLMEEFKSAKLSPHIFLTHFHWDHIQGIPFFRPLYQAENEVTFYSSDRLSPLQERLQGLMAKPYFPVSFEVLSGRRTFVEIGSEPVKRGDVCIYPFPLNHPQGAVGYRIESPRGVIVYATDLEHGHQELDDVVREYSRRADILIFDAQYAPDEYESHKGWGHSTWLEATRVARDAGVKQLVLFHHDPWHNDKTLFDIVKQARTFFENTFAASEGWFAEV
jgi:phosphoribosyl 1,2-cyclic phosphodiesterase